MPRSSIRRLSLLCWFLCCGAVEMFGQDASRAASDPVFDPPTLHAISARWAILGDANRDAVVRVRHRVSGTTTWRETVPFLRVLPSEQQGNTSMRLGTRGGFTFAGSVVGLMPGTAYEVQLELADGDGGGTTFVGSVTTWSEPRLPEGLIEKHVVPGAGGGRGTAEEPYRGLIEALADVGPGQVLILHPGTYLRDEPLAGTAAIRVDGEPGRPIVIRSLEPGRAVLHGGGSFDTAGCILDAHSRRHLWFEDLVFRGRQCAIAANKCSDFVIRGCRFTEVSAGFASHGGEPETSRHHFIADNVFAGPYAWPPIEGAGNEAFVAVSGAGHVICHNLVVGAGDGVRGSKEGRWSACDIYRNDFRMSNDDAIEADHSDHDVRIYENRIVDAVVGISADPSRGGPAYIFRNVLYNTTFGPFRLHGHTTGVVIYHNTSVRSGYALPIVPGNESVTNLVMRNNIFLGDGDHGFYVTTKKCFDWDVDADGYGGFEKALGLFKGTVTYRESSQMAKDGLIYTGRGAFALVPRECFAKKVEIPVDSQIPTRVEALDFALHRRSRAADLGVDLPGFNDDREGKRPDLGALERGSKPPAYGPRQRR